MAAASAWATSQHCGVVIVCDGTDAAAKRIERVLWNDPATGVMRHADAGYDEAVRCAREQGLKLPMVRCVTHRRCTPAQLTLAQLQAIHAGGVPLAAGRRGARCASAPAPRWCSAPPHGDAPVYGVNTGFGKLATTRISAADLATLQLQPDPLAQRRRRRAAGARGGAPDAGR